MRFLSWAEFEAAVDHIAADCAARPFCGVYGLPRGGLVLAVSLSHRLDLPLLAAPRPGCLVVDDVYETGRTLEPFRQLKGAAVVVWISKVEPRWWQAVETTPGPDWLVFPWEDRARAEQEERAYRQSRATAAPGALHAAGA
jgi:hypoxanthine phosphoribosyltransferase